MNRLIILICAAFLFHGNAMSQSIDSSLVIYNNRFPQEKLHIHFDKDTYLPGETVWMKAYLLKGARPSDLSKNIYFDWTDADGRLLLHSISPLKEGVASSYFKIPAWVKNGVVHVKAYTQWMLNFDNDFLFNKDIPVLMPAGEGNSVPEKMVSTLNLFPEGGDLINGVSSQVAFEALNNHGGPVQISGAIFNANHVFVDSFYTSYKGMGSLIIKPVAGEHYTANWTDENGHIYNTPLPEAKS